MKRLDKSFEFARVSKTSLLARLKKAEDVEITEILSNDDLLWSNCTKFQYAAYWKIRVDTISRISCFHTMFFSVVYAGLAPWFEPLDVSCRRLVLAIACLR